jgi:glutamyl-tRNA synthetase
MRTRIAPSPTGDPHVGTAYVALFNYALARRNRGQFLLRVEDTDRQRSSADSERMIFEALRWLGLSWDEGPDVGGPHGPYRQSERTAIYREHAEILVGRGAAYPCFCTPERLAQLREEQKEARAAVMGYDGRCRRLDPAEARKRRDAGEAHVVRLAMPEADSMTVSDRLRGELRFERPQMDDQVLLKSDGFPTYHLANVVDDHLMGISHVLRAEEWLSSLPKHFRLYEAFGWEPPVFCHLPLLRNADRSKISKRKNPVSLNYYREEGFLPEALLNFLALMSYSMPDGREEFGLREFVDGFDLERISLGGPVFDLEKLRWLNGRYLRRLSIDELAAMVPDPRFPTDYMLQVVGLCRERADTLKALREYMAFFLVAELQYEAPVLRAMIPAGRDKVETRRALNSLRPRLGEAGWEASSIEASLTRHAEAVGWPAKELFMAVRVAVTGRSATPPLFETMQVLGREKCDHRLFRAFEALA